MLRGRAETGNLPNPHAQPEKISPFRQRVYDACRRIPRGKVTTYKLLGEAIGCACPRAVGQALRRNPFAPDVPCHRVVASDLTLGGFAGQRGGKEVDRKRRMLVKEGVVFSGDRVHSRHQVFRFDQEVST